MSDRLRADTGADHAAGERLLERPNVGIPHIGQIAVWPPSTNSTVPVT
jgi:hypothetical protein